MASSTSLLAITAILLVFTYIYYQTLKFRHVPGPFFTKISGLPVLYHTLTLNRTRWIHALHTKYGHIVRLGPNEVSINDVDAITPVYNFEKTYFYEAFICYGKRNMFSTPDRKNHAPKRKNLDAVRTNVLRPETLTMVYDRCHQMVTQIVPDSPRDTFPLLNYMIQDIISGFFFGDKNGSRCLQGEDTDFLGAWHIRHSTFHWFAEPPAVANMIYGSKFGDYLPTWRKALEGEKKIIESYDKWMGRLDPQDSYL